MAALVYRDTLKPDAQDSDLPSEYFRRFDPFLEEPALFHAFADLQALPWPPEFRKADDVTRLRDSVLAFANRYGAPEVRGEFLLAVNQEIHHLRAAIELWEGGRQRDQEAIAKYIKWNKRLGWNLAGSPLEYFQVPEDWPAAPRRKDQVIEQAARLVDLIIEHKCGHDFQIKPERNADGGVTLAVEIDELLSALWLQFAFAVAGDKQYRRCEVCQRAFELAPGENRADRRFCSDKCRIRAYRQRKARAIEMRAAGAQLRKIARELDTDVATVCVWVGEE
jgi:hypothetical protein